LISRWKSVWVDFRLQLISVRLQVTIAVTVMPMFFFLKRCRYANVVDFLTRQIGKLVKQARLFSDPFCWSVLHQMFELCCFLGIFSVPLVLHCFIRDSELSLQFKQALEAEASNFEAVMECFIVLKLYPCQTWHCQELQKKVTRRRINKKNHRN